MAAPCFSVFVFIILKYNNSIKANQSAAILMDPIECYDAFWLANTISFDERPFVWLHKPCEAVITKVNTFNQA